MSLSLIASPNKDNTVGVVVLYRPDSELGSRLAPVVQQVTKVVVVGNDQGGADRLAGMNGANFEYIENPSNVGLATALNQGLRRAEELGAQWCLLLDQDTLIDGDLLVGLGRVYDAYPAPVRIAILAPNYRSRAGGRLAYSESPAYQELRTVVTSGSLVRIEAIAACGGMKEEFFIEGIDLEFALRVRRAGWMVVASGRPLMTHGAGACEERRLLWRTVQVGHHSPERYYLQYRNLIWTIKENFYFDPRWAINSLGAIAKKALLVLIFEKNCGQKLKYMLRGALVGWHNRLVADAGHRFALFR